MVSSVLRDSRLLICVVVTCNLAAALVACGGSAADTTPPEVEGPALIMFYTDN